MNRSVNMAIALALMSAVCVTGRAADVEKIKPSVIAVGPNYQIYLAGTTARQQVVYKKLSTEKERALLSFVPRQVNERDRLRGVVDQRIEGVVVDDERLYILMGYQASGRVRTPSARGDRAISQTTHQLHVFWLDDGTRIYRQDVTELSDGMLGEHTLEHGLLTPLEEGVEFAGATFKFDGSGIAAVLRDDELIQLQQQLRIG